MNKKYTFLVFCFIYYIMITTVSAQCDEYKISIGVEYDEYYTDKTKKIEYGLKCVTIKTINGYNLHRFHIVYRTTRGDVLDLLKSFYYGEYKLNITTTNGRGEAYILVISKDFLFQKGTEFFNRSVKTHYEERSIINILKKLACKKVSKLNLLSYKLSDQDLNLLKYFKIDYRMSDILYILSVESNTSEIEKLMTRSRIKKQSFSCSLAESDVNVINYTYNNKKLEENEINKILMKDIKNSFPSTCTVSKNKIQCPKKNAESTIEFKSKYFCVANLPDGIIRNSTNTLSFDFIYKNEHKDYQLIFLEDNSVFENQNSKAFKQFKKTILNGLEHNFTNVNNKFSIPYYIYHNEYFSVNLNNDTKEIVNLNYKKASVDPHSKTITIYFKKIVCKDKKIQLNQSNSRNKGQNDIELQSLKKFIAHDTYKIDSLNDTICVPNNTNDITLKFDEKDIKCKINDAQANCTIALPKKNFDIKFKNDKQKNDIQTILLTFNDIQIDAINKSNTRFPLINHESINYTLKINSHNYEEYSNILNNNLIKSGSVEVDLNPIMRKLKIIAKIEADSCSYLNKVTPTSFMLDGKKYFFNRYYNFEKSVSLAEIQLCHNDKSKWMLSIVRSNDSKKTDEFYVYLKRKLQKKQFSLSFIVDQSITEELEIPYTLTGFCQNHPVKELTIRLNKKTINKAIKIGRKVDWPQQPIREDKLKLQLSKPIGINITLEERENKKWDKELIEFDLSKINKVYVKKTPPRKVMYIDLTDKDTDRRKIYNLLQNLIKSKEPIDLYISDGIKLHHAKNINELKEIAKGLGNINPYKTQNFYKDFNEIISKSNFFRQKTNLYLFISHAVFSMICDENSRIKKIMNKLHPEIIQIFQHSINNQQIKTCRIQHSKIIEYSNIVISNDSWGINKVRREK